MKGISLLILLAIFGLASSSLAATINVPAGGNLQQALDTAQPGDTLILEAGATFTGPFVLRNKGVTTSYITIQSSALGSLPAAGQRVSPIHAVSMPRIVAPNGSEALFTEPSASYYRIIGIEFSPVSAPANASAGIDIDTLILLGDGSSAQSSLSQVPHHLEIDRCYIHGYTTSAIKRGIGLNSSETSVINSYISDIHLQGNDAQGIGGWNGPGPFHIVNNFVAASGENIMFGGSLPSIYGLVPSNIEIFRNHLFKPLSWKPDEADYAGVHWSVKNLLEFKSGQHVLIEGNLLENNWGDTGYGALNLTVRNDSGSWATIQDLTFRHNIVRHVSLGVNILGLDTSGPTVQGHDVRFIDNLFYDMNGSRWSESGYWLKLNSMNRLTLDHNLILNASSIISVEGAPCTDFVMTNNIAPHNTYGIKGQNLESGRDTINAFFPQSVFRRNVIAGLTSGGTSLTGYPYYYPAVFPTDNFYPATLDEVGFVNLNAGDYRLAAGTTYKGLGTDGLDIGIDQNTLGALLTQPFYFSAANYTGYEGAGSVTITINRSGTELPPASVNYATGDGTAHQSGDYNITLGTLGFGAGETSKTFTVFITDDGYVEGDETAYLYLSNPNGIAAFGVPTATLTIVSNDSGNSQPLDGTAFFVRQHYIDFLGREPDQVGFQGWQDILNNCPPSGQNANGWCDRIEVSSDFFRSEEFQTRGYFIYRFYSAIGRIPIYSDFMPDFAKVSGYLSTEQLEANKVAFVNEFMTRQEFRNKYEPLTTPTAYVDGLLQTVGLPNHPSRLGWISGLTNGSLTRAQVLRGLVDSNEVYQKYYNEAFVIMQYFGYLRRTADGSYVDWINIMNQYGGDYRIMINGFMNSAEYRQRFGP